MHISLLKRTLALIRSWDDFEYVFTPVVQRFAKYYLNSSQLFKSVRARDVSESLEASIQLKTPEQLTKLRRSYSPFQSTGPMNKQEKIQMQNQLDQSLASASQQRQKKGMPSPSREEKIYQDVYQEFRNRAESEL